MFFISAVNAEDVNASDISIANEINVIDEVNDNQNVSVNVENEKLSEGDEFDLPPSTYYPRDSEAVSVYVRKALDGDTIVLSGDYSFSSKINIYTSINFIGTNDATVTGNSFIVNANNVTFTNITFRDAYSDRAISASEDAGSFKVINCTFINNKVGAIYRGNAINSTFINNSANYGAAIHSGNAINCIFKNNTVGNNYDTYVHYGGAIYYGSAVSCIFINNRAMGSDSNGGALSEGYAVNCTFINNHADKNGGAIDRGDYAVNCIFINNSAGDEFGAAAIYRGSIVNCTFINNFVENSGGAVHIANDVSVINSTFINNSANYGGAIYSYAYAHDQIHIINCSFMGNSAEYGGAIYESYGNCIVFNSSFIGNSANYGGATYNVVLSNSSLENNVALHNGGAMNDGIAKSCTFINNTAKEYGGAVYGGKVSIDSIFINNKANVGNDSYGTLFSDFENTLEDLNSTINNNTDLDIYLDGDYLFDFLTNRDYVFVDGINITRDVIIHGNGFTIDANKKGRIFNILNGTVVIRDVIFQNCRGSSGGVIFGHCTVINCTFIDNQGSAYGGALYECDAINCTFINNVAASFMPRGGAMYYGNAWNCTFINNHAGGYEGDGGAIFEVNAVNCIFINNAASATFESFGGAAYGGEVFNCTFIGNNATKGGAIYNCNAVNCIFINNTADGKMSTYGSALNLRGGAIYGGSAVNSTFIGNRAYYGGAIYSGTAADCEFINNSATESGGAIYDGKSTVCTFIGNHANEGGAVFDTYVATSLFENNSASIAGGAVSGNKATSCIFNNNSAGEYGGAVYKAKVSVDSTFNNNAAKIGDDTYDVEFFTVGKNFNDLIWLINSTDDLDIYLDQDYIYDWGFDYAIEQGIIINRTLTIHGNGFKIDAEKYVRIFNVTAVNVVFKDIIFANGFMERGYGGAINGPCTVINCTFMYTTIGDSHFRSYGGALSGGSAWNCTFIGNHADDYGGAIYNGNAVNCIFINCYSEYDGGAIWNGSAWNCTFINISAEDDGGAIWNGSAWNCTFINCSGDDGGAIWNGSAWNCVFINNSGINGGAIWNGGAWNCTFINNSAKTSSYYQNGGIIWNGSAWNCTFNNNAASGAIIWDGGAVNCSFTNNSWYILRKGNAINCTFAYNMHYHCVFEGDAINCSFIGNNECVYKGNVLNCSFIGNNECVGNGNVLNCSFTDNAYCIGNGNVTNCIIVNSGGSLFNGYVIGCKFINTSGYGEGNVFNSIFINNKGSGFSVNAVNCSFVNNSGGAIRRGSALNCTFINNTATDGGAMSNGDAVNCIFINNTATGYGGATSNVNAFNCTFINNSVVSGWAEGGAMCSGSAVNCTFVNNSASGFYGFGGALYECDAVNSSFFNNSGVRGGAMYFGSAVNCSFIGNSAVNDGGALYGTKATNCSLINNSANQEGGAIDYGSAVNCTFINNNATAGGAICNMQTVINCTFINNTANHGGAIEVLYSNTIINNCQFINCSSVNQGGAIYWSGGNYLTINNCTFAGCTSGDGKSYISFKNSYMTYHVYDCIFDVVPQGIVYSYNPILSVNDLVVVKGREGILKANLSDLFGPLANKPVTLTIRGTDLTQYTDSEGIIAFNITDYLTGDLNVTLSFAGEDIINPVSTNANVVITYTTVNVNDLSIYVGEDGYLMANLSDVFGVLPEKLVLFDIDGYLCEVITDDDGIASLNIHDFLSEAGKYTVYITFDGDEYCSEASANASVTINKFDSVLSADSLSIVKGDESFLTANLSDIRGPLSGETVTFVINGKQYSRLTNSDGSAVLDITDIITNYGMNEVDVIYAGSRQNNPNSIMTNVSVNIIKGILTVTPIGKYYDDTFLSFKLVNSKTNESIPNCPFDLIISDGQTIHLATDSKGLANYKLSLIPGLYNISTHVTSPYSDINDVKFTDFEICEIVGKIELSHEENSKILNVRLYNEETGDAYRNIEVNLQFNNGVKVEVTTDDDGVASYTMSFMVGTYYVIANVNGDYTHFDSVQLSDIEITNKEPTTVIFGSDKIVFDYSSSKSIPVTIIGGTTNRSYISVLDHPEAIIDFNGTTLTVSGLDADNYILQLVTIPDSNHYSVTSTIDVVVNRILSELSFSKNLQFDYLESDYTKVTVKGGYLDLENITVIGYPDAIISLDNDIITVSGIDAGSYTLYADVTPDKNHLTFSNTAHITVNKIDSHIWFNGIVFRYSESGSTSMDIVGGTVDLANITIDDCPDADISLDGNVITVSGLDVGNYTMRVKITPDKNYYYSDASLKITVTKIDSEVTFIGDLTHDYLDDGSILINVKGGYADISGIHVLNYSDAKISISTSNVIKVSNLPAGDYVLSVNTTPTSNYNRVEAFSSFSVNKIPSKVTIPTGIVTRYLESGSTFVYVDGCTVDEDNCYVEGHSEAVIKVNKNEIIVSNLAVGSYVLHVDSTPDENHSASSAVVGITVNKIPAKLKASSMSTYQKSGKTWTIKLTDSKTGAPLANMRVTVMIYTKGKVKTDTPTTNSKGQITYKVSTWAAGSHKVVISLNNAGYSSNSLTVTVKVLKTTQLKFSAKPVSESTGSRVYIWVKIGKNFKNGIKLYLDAYTGKKYKRFNLITGTYKDKQGKVNKGFIGYATNMLSAGTHTIIVTPVLAKYSGKLSTKLVIKKSAKKYKNVYSLISNGKQSFYYK